MLRGSRFRECLTVLPILRAQLQETSRQVETAVTRVCGSFTDIADRARKAVAGSSTLLDGQGDCQGATVEGAIETSRQTIAAMLERMERAAGLSTLAVSSMDEVSRVVSGIEDLLGQVHRIAFTNKLVALNAKIEAVHVGELGSGFEVVADEISRQADKSTELVDGITSHIQQMRAHVNSTVGQLRDFLAEDRQKLDESRRDAEGALNVLLGLHRQTRASLERSTEENSRLTGSIASAVVDLQFQDRMKQRVEHVVEALEKVESCLAGGRSGLLAEMQSSYSMESERTAHDRAVKPTDSASSEEQETEVEIF